VQPTTTFLMTDVEGSTRLWEESATVAGSVIARHEALIASAVSEHGGELIRSKGEGDSTFSVFADARAAVLAAVALQRGIGSETWPDGIDLRVRAAIYTGEAERRDGDYYGTGPNRGARLRAAAHGGQTICSAETERLVSGRWPSDVALIDLGLHRLRDLARAERIFQVAHPELPSEFPPLRSLGVRHNLPAQRTSFVGRTEDLIAVEKRLQEGRLVTLTGVGGSGKTRLAVEVASDQLDSFPDGVFFADLSPVSDPHVVAGAVAAAVGFSRLAIGTGSGRPANELMEFLSSRQTLIVLDNCEHVVDAAAHLVDEILERCPDVTVLATSREALQLQGEQTYPVRPLDLPDADAPLDAESTRLFCARASAVHPGFEALPENADDIAEICRRLDGIPLAIELAAAQVAHLSARQIVERLGDRFRLLAGGRGRAHRQKTLHAALDWSHDLLGPDERLVFRRLAVFPGDFTARAAEAVCGEDGFDALGSLVAKSLVVAEDERADRRYRLLETVRVYAEEKLVEVGEDGAARDAHRDHFLEMVESIPAERTYLDPDGVIERERHNLRAALNWSHRRGRADLVGRLASTMNRIWMGDIREGRRWLAIGVEAADELAPEHRVRVLAVAAHVAVLAIQAYDGELARAAVEAAAGQRGFSSSLAHGLLCLNTGIRYMLSKNPVFRDESIELGRKAIEVADDPFSETLAWFWLGQARVLHDDLDGAVDALRRASEVRGEAPDMSSLSLAMLAGIFHIQGRHDEALAAASEVIERATSVASALWAWVLYSTLPLALELGWRGRHSEALDVVRERLDESGMIRTPGVMTTVLVVLMALAVQRGDAETAGVLLEYAGVALLRDGIRTPVDIALYSFYADKARPLRSETDAARHRDVANAMTLNDALALGLNASDTPSA
jgi:predicted ATPase/class 3 adenylate cyclase